MFGLVQHVTSIHPFASIRNRFETNKGDSFPSGSSIIPLMPARRIGKDEFVNLAFRTEPSQIAELERVLKEKNAKLKGPRWNRSMYMRLLLAQALRKKDPFEGLEE